MLIFTGLFLCSIALFLLIYRWKNRRTGKLVDGTIVGYVRGGRGTYGFVGYNYRVRIEYEGETYFVKAMDNVVGTNDTMPNKHLGLHCHVYFHPDRPDKPVIIKGFYQIEWLSLLLLVLGLVAIIFSVGENVTHLSQ